MGYPDTMCALCGETMAGSPEGQRADVCVLLDSAGVTLEIRGRPQMAQKTAPWVCEKCLRGAMNDWAMTESARVQAAALAALNPEKPQDEIPLAGSKGAREAQTAAVPEPAAAAPAGQAPAAEITTLEAPDVAGTAAGGKPGKATGK